MDKILYRKAFFERSSIDLKKTDSIIILFSKVILIAVSVSFFMYSLTYDYFYHEIDSYMLPTISMEYRRSIVITQDDIDRARIDYPELYEDVQDFSTLRSAGLNKCSEDKWISFYFPVYPFACMPAKLILQLSGLDQARAFPVTNSVMLIITLFIVYRRLKVSPFGKLAAIVLLIVSPITKYIQYISCETMLFSLITIALVLYQSNNYRSSALLISIASMTNPTVMAIGLVMITEYFVGLIRNRKNVRVFSSQNVLNTVKYGCFYIPCLIPFAFNFFMLRTGNPTAGGATLSFYGQRVLSYLFDINFGFASFAPFTLLLFFVLIIVSVLRKKYKCIVYAGFFICPVLAYSLMIFINCIAIFCSRYVMWTYPALVIGIVVIIEDIKIKPFLEYAAFFAAVVSSNILLSVNSTDISCFTFNASARFLLDNHPGLYSPFYGTFYNRNDGYNLSHLAQTPSYYFSSQDNYLTKLLFKSTPEYKKQIISQLSGDPESEKYLKDKLDNIPDDEKYHYLNISPGGTVKLEKKNPQQLGIISEDKAVFESEDPICIPSAQDSDHEAFIEFRSEPCVLYKVDIEYDQSTLPEKTDNVSVSLNGNCSSSDNNYSQENCCTYFINSEENRASQLKIENKNDTQVSIRNIKITSMKNNNKIMNIRDPFTTQGNMAESVSAFDFAPESFKYYKVTVRIKNPELIDEEDELFFRMSYQSDYSPYIPEHELSEAENTFNIYSGDMTLATSECMASITGKTKNPVIISSVEIEETVK
ncbi:MAG: hypothetical protein Q4F95_09860 [Oscillospiraceae bacterium]|nr:hypothetical protein [Oscillospiraceae bacterium]